nr:hypothetical protein [uncultured Emticicia sp.]
MKIPIYIITCLIIILSCTYNKASLVSPSNLTEAPLNTDPTGAAPETLPPSQLACATTATTISTICFDSQVLPIIYSNCAESGCHDSKTRAEGYDLSTYNGIMKGVSAGSSSKSKIYTEMSSGKMPESPRKMAISQIAIIKQWIDEGAKNITCGAIVIDSANPTFSKSIKPIIDTYCVGCHQTKAAQGSVILDNYTFIKNYVDNQKLWHVVNYHLGYVGMPLNQKLGNCQIEAIKKWIIAGAVNN